MPIVHRHTVLCRSMCISSILAVLTRSTRGRPQPSVAMRGGDGVPVSLYMAGDMAARLLPVCSASTRRARWQLRAGDPRGRAQPARPRRPAVVEPLPAEVGVVLARILPAPPLALDAASTRCGRRNALAEQPHERGEGVVRHERAELRGARRPAPRGRRGCHQAIDGVARRPVAVGIQKIAATRTPPRGASQRGAPVAPPRGCGRSGICARVTRIERALHGMTSAKGCSRVPPLPWSSS